MQSEVNFERENQRQNKSRMVIMMVVLGLAYFFSNFHRLSLGVVSDTIQTEFQLSTTQLGLLGSALFYPYAIMQLPSGFIGDRVPANKLIAASCILTACSTLLFSVSQQFSLLVVARMMAGVATALVYVPALAAIRRKFGDAVYGTMVGIMVSLGQIGAVCASAPLQFLTNVLGWRKAFFIIGCLTVILSIGCWLFIDDNKNSSQTKQKKENAWKMVVQPFAIALIVWFFITGGSRLSFQSLWGGKFFTEALSMSPDASSIMLMCISIGCIVGASILGSISDRIGSTKTVIFSSLIFVCTWIAYAVCKENSSRLFIGAVGILLGAFGAGGFTVGFSCISLFAKKQYTGTITGIVNFFTFTGSAIFTQVCGSFMESLPVSTARGQFQVLFICFAAASLIVTLVLWGSGRKIKGASDK